MCTTSRRQRQQYGKQAAAAAHFFLYRSGVKVPRDTTHVFVHPSVTALPNDVFAHCRLLKEVVLSEGLLRIGAYAFDCCVSLERLLLPSTLLNIGEWAFACCTSLRELVLPEGLTAIGKQAFCDCCYLELVSLPSTLTFIPVMAFFDCASLKVVRWTGSGIRRIGDAAFHSCRSLVDLTLPATAIGGNVFGDCESLKMVTLCGGIQLIEAGAFECSVLESVTSPSTALVVTDGRDKLHFYLAMDGIIPHADSAMVVIASECFNSMRIPEMADVESAIVDIMGRRVGWDDQRERLRTLLAPHELCHKQEVTTILELGLWKTAMDKVENMNLSVREERRVNCGADSIIPYVLPFL